jgi:hypothetical protein
VSAIDPAFSAIVALATALLFGAAALHKLADWPRFRAALAGYQVAPGWLVPALAAALVALEIAAAALLPAPATRAAGSLLAAALFGSYAVAIAVNLRRGRTRIDCGCFGAGSRDSIGSWMVIRNLLLSLLVLVATLPVTNRSLTALDAMTIIGAVVCLAILYTAQEVLQRVALHPAGSTGT